ncbi:YciI family protein [Hirschia baltica]|uniref:YCII-related n=1 Tax=Hirschia baltica (strain ATCC 49814 / DSM 5838 / IFAM 1418) TaxID=582402 RepID=C6XRF7_HIRBI|nr:YciI family protein [Hirschia baltica]ACT58789.1 YCII-related [Hirschia baltica ATCC 49814]
MQFLCLIYGTEGKDPQPGTPEFGAYMQDYETFSALCAQNGVLVNANALEPVATASTVTMENGKAEIMDGPFAETKEQLGGYYLLECKDLDEALEYAAKIPTARYGRVEVRPIMVFE